MNKRGRGRPPGRSETRGEILAVARRRFLAEGYDRVSLRSIAAEAGVDVALISYHFGSKRGLFGAALALAANPPELLARALDGPLNSLPERVARTVLDAWADPATGGQLRTFMRTAIREPDVARLFREMLEREMITRIADRIGGADAPRSASIAVSQIAGVLLARHVLGFEPIASMPVDELVRRMAPALRAALAGPRPAGATRLATQSERW
jgi:AcrR family transcriptional regulator